MQGLQHHVVSNTNVRFMFPASLRHSSAVMSFGEHISISRSWLLNIIVQPRTRYTTPFRRAPNLLSLTTDCGLATMSLLTPGSVVFACRGLEDIRHLRVCCVRNWFEYELLALLPFLADLTSLLRVLDMYAALTSYTASSSISCCFVSSH